MLYLWLPFWAFLASITLGYAFFCIGANRRFRCEARFSAKLRLGFERQAGGADAVDVRRRALRYKVAQSRAG